MANRFVHMELTTDDAAKAAVFYKQLFTWKIAPTEGMPYFMVDTGSKEGGAGLQNKLTPEARTGWMPYVEVESVKDTIAKARSLGGTVQVEFQPIPGMGAMGIFTDPSGATLGVWEPEKKPARKPAPRKKPAKKKGRK